MDSCSEIEMEEEPELPGLKGNVQRILNFWLVEVVLVLLIFLDLGIIFLEFGLDHQYICIGGFDLPVAPSHIQGMFKDRQEAGGDSLLADFGQVHHYQNVFGSVNRSSSTGTIGKAPLVWNVSSTYHALVGDQQPFAQVMQKSMPSRLNNEPNAAQGASLIQLPTLAKQRQVLTQEASLLGESAKQEPSLQQEASSLSPRLGTDTSMAHNMLDGKTEGNLNPHEWQQMTKDPKFAAFALAEDSARRGPEKGGGASHKEGRHEHAHASSLICQGEHGHDVHHIAHRCHLASILILVIFEIELLVKIWLDPQEFFHSKSEMMDWLVVSLSLFFDVFGPTIIKFATKGAHSTQSMELSADIVAFLLMFLRLWRIVRIGHGLFETARKAHTKFTEMKKEATASKLRIQELEDELAKTKGKK